MHPRRCLYYKAVLALLFQAALIDAFGPCHNYISTFRHLHEHATLLQQHATSSADEESSAHPRKEYLATCIPGLATYLEEELRECGVSETQVLSDAAVSFSAHDESTPLKVLLWTRTAHRILEQIDTFHGVESRDDVYDAVRHSRMHVKDLLGDGRGGLLTLSVKVIANGRLPKDISHSHYTALTIKNALVDQVRDLKDGDRPDVELEDPDVPLVAILHAQGMSADMTIYRSLAPPGSLHRRGYRSGGVIHKAAMKESLAAGLLLAAGWKDAVRHLEKTASDNGTNVEGLTLVDPMCGSGSLLLEAAMMTVDFAPGLMRIMNQVPGHQLPPVLRWKGNNERLLPIWKEMLLEASKAVKSRFAWLRDNDGLVSILGNDIHTGALELVEASLKKAGGLDRLLELHQNDCCDWNALQNKTQQLNRKVWVVTNPPWGVRLTDDDHLSWESLRTFLREKCPRGQTQAWVLSGNKEATKHLGLRRSQSLALKTGEQDLRWIQYIMEDRTKLPAGDETDNSRRQRSAPINSWSSSPPQQKIRTRSVRTSLTQRPANPSRRPQRSKPPRPQKVSNADDSWI